MGELGNKILIWYRCKFRSWQAQAALTHKYVKDGWLVMNRKYLDFEVIKESWNKYSLQDGTKLKSRAMLKSVWTEEVDGTTKHNVEIDQQQVCLCDPSVQGEPSTMSYPKEQLEGGIDVKNCRYTTLQYEPSEYLLDDGTKILLHVSLLNIARTRFFDHVGNRIYLTDATGQMNVERPTK